MEESRSDVVLIWDPARRRHISIARQSYSLISAEIVAIVREHDVITLNELINELTERLASIIKVNLPWYILKIKTDLATRKFISVRTNVGAHRDQLIRLSKRRKNTSRVASMR